MKPLAEEVAPAPPAPVPGPDGLVAAPPLELVVLLDPLPEEVLPEDPVEPLPELLPPLDT
jgi:hypothetical protein